MVLCKFKSLYWTRSKFIGSSWPCMNEKRSSLFIPFIILKLYILAVPMTLYDDGALKRGGLIQTK